MKRRSKILVSCFFQTRGNYDSKNNIAVARYGWTPKLSRARIKINPVRNNKRSDAHLSSARVTKRRRLLSLTKLVLKYVEGWWVQTNPRILLNDLPSCERRKREESRGLYRCTEFSDESLPLPFSSTSRTRSSVVESLRSSSVLQPSSKTLVPRYTNSGKIICIDTPVRKSLS